MSKILASIFFFLLLSAQKAEAHVGYVSGNRSLGSNFSPDVAFLFSALTSPLNILLIFLTVLFTITLVFFIQKLEIKKFFTPIIKRLEKRKGVVPGIIRFALSLALLEAGLSGYLVSPLADATKLLSVMQILAGVLILTGLLVVPTAILVTIFYFLALFQNPYILGNLDFYTLTLSLVILPPTKPNIDSILHIRILSPLGSLSTFVPLILRLGIGVSMIYLAFVEKLLNPHASALVVEEFRLTSVLPVSTQMWVFSTGIVEIIVGILLMLGIYTRLVSLITFVILIMSLFYFRESVFSHITLFATAISLFILGPGKVMRIKKFSR